MRNELAKVTMFMVPVLLVVGLVAQMFRYEMQTSGTPPFQSTVIRDRITGQLQICPYGHECGPWR